MWPDIILTIIEIAIHQHEDFSNESYYLAEAAHENETKTRCA